MAVTSISAAEPPGPHGIVEVVAPHVKLSPLGDAQLQGACPFCGSRAVRVRPAYNTFHCFGCGVGGDARMSAVAPSRGVVVCGGGIGDPSVVAPDDLRRRGLIEIRSANEPNDRWAASRRAPAANVLFGLGLRGTPN